MTFFCGFWGRDDCKFAVMEQKFKNYREDFELWARECVRIRHKLTGQMVAWELNGPQRRVLGVMERQRRAGRPVRVILLKARQWGGSTLVSLYMAWIQLFHSENWHSLICAHFKDASTTIRGLYSQLIENYPEELLPKGVKLVPYEGMRSVKLLTVRGCRISVCSAENVDAARGADYAMAHLSEVAFWADTPGKKASDLVRAICGSVPRVPNSVIVMESTANGVGNFFHREWVRAQAGESDKEAVFVPWFEIEMYREELTCPVEELKSRLTPYERELMETEHLSPEQINWYHLKSREYAAHEQMAAEYPSNPSEAFTSTEVSVFPARYIESLRRGVSEPIERYDFERERQEFFPTVSGALEVWAEPCKASELQGRHSYVAAVDVGGRWAGADWSVIAVFDVRNEGRMELAAQWRGHIDHDILGSIALALGRRYHNALLVIESNTLESQSLGVMERIVASRYRNLYQRACLESAGRATEYRYGFHTNVATKTAAMADLMELLRDGRLTERSAGAIEELAAYARRPNGSMGAPDGMHDDLVMTRAIAAYALRQISKK